MISSARAALAVALLLVVAPVGWAQPQRQITGEGTEGFRALLASRKLQPLDNPDKLTVDPAHTLLVCFRGADHRIRSYPDQVAGLNFNVKTEFVDRGGALFFASDQSMKSSWNRSFGFQIHGGLLVGIKSDLGSCYRSEPEYPFVKQITGRLPNLFKPRDQSTPDSEPLTKVATNRPSYLLRSDELESLAVYAAICQEIAPQAPSEPFGARFSAVFAQAQRYDGGGRILVLADHSVFINSMLLPLRFPNDNLAFATNCLDWLLLGPDTGTRQYVMFMEDGRIWGKDDYNLMLQTMPANPEELLKLLADNPELLWQNRELAEELVAKAERGGLLAELERGNENDPDRKPPIMSALQDLLERALSRFVIVRFVLILGTLALLGYVIVAFIRAKFSRARRVPRLSVALDRVRPRAGLLEMRLRGGVGRGQYHEIARDRAREMFASLDLTPADGSPPPNYTIDAGWWWRGRIERQLREAWSVAFGAEPVPVSARQWEHWQTHLDELKTMMRRGAIRFEET
jgi:hypothetical protein